VLLLLLLFIHLFFFQWFHTVPLHSTLFILLIQGVIHSFWFLIYVYILLIHVYSICCCCSENLIPIHSDFVLYDSRSFCPTFFNFAIFSLLLHSDSVRACVTFRFCIRFVRFVVRLSHSTILFFAFWFRSFAFFSFRLIHFFIPLLIVTLSLFWFRFHVRFFSVCVLLFCTVPFFPIPFGDFVWFHVPRDLVWFYVFVPDFFFALFFTRLSPVRFLVPTYRSRLPILFVWSPYIRFCWVTSMGDGIHSTFGHSGDLFCLLFTLHFTLLISLPTTFPEYVLRCLHSYIHSFLHSDWSIQAVLFTFCWSLLFAFVLRLLQWYVVLLFRLFFCCLMFFVTFTFINLFLLSFSILCCPTLQCSFTFYTTFWFCSSHIRLFCCFVLFVDFIFLYSTFLLHSFCSKDLRFFFFFWVDSFYSRSFLPIVLVAFPRFFFVPLFCSFVVLVPVLRCLHTRSFVCVLVVRSDLRLHSFWFYVLVLHVLRLFCFAFCLERSTTYSVLFPIFLFARPWFVTFPDSTFCLRCLHFVESFGDSRYVCSCSIVVVHVPDLIFVAFYFVDFFAFIRSLLLFLFCCLIFFCILFCLMDTFLPTLHFAVLPVRVRSFRSVFGSFFCFFFFFFWFCSWSFLFVFFFTVDSFRSFCSVRSLCCFFLFCVRSSFYFAFTIPFVPLYVLLLLPLIFLFGVRCCLLFTLFIRSTVRPVSRFVAHVLICFARCCSRCIYSVLCFVVYGFRCFFFFFCCSNYDSVTIRCLVRWILHVLVVHSLPPFLPSLPNPYLRCVHFSCSFVFASLPFSYCSSFILVSTHSTLRFLGICSPTDSIFFSFLRFLFRFVRLPFIVLLFVLVWVVDPVCSLFCCFFRFLHFFVGSLHVSTLFSPWFFFAVLHSFLRSFLVLRFLCVPHSTFSRFLSLVTVLPPLLGDTTTYVFCSFYSFRFLPFLIFWISFSFTFCVFSNFDFFFRFLFFLPRSFVSTVFVLFSFFVLYCFHSVLVSLLLHLDFYSSRFRFVLFVTTLFVLFFFFRLQSTDSVYRLILPFRYIPHFSLVVCVLHFCFLCFCCPPFGAMRCLFDRLFAFCCYVDSFSHSVRLFFSFPVWSPSVFFFRCWYVLRFFFFACCSVVGYVSIFFFVRYSCCSFSFDPILFFWSLHSFHFFFFFCFWSFSTHSARSLHSFILIPTFISLLVVFSTLPFGEFLPSRFFRSSHTVLYLSFSPIFVLSTTFLFFFFLRLGLFCIFFCILF